jgi:hypothetical protein
MWFWGTGFPDQIPSTPRDGDVIDLEGMELRTS